ncbi:MAG: NUDIX hydrolase [Candidatus Eremiobacteraeota bacterium]|nr:NUDIX hydrolase [Candidatus Eremiobacteraeota bacterium]
MDKRIRIRIAVVIPRGDEILLVRHVKGDRQYWLIPGGGLDWGETIEDCAKREIKEETNLDVKIIKLLFISESVSKEDERHLINLTFLGKALNPEDEIKVLDDDRIVEARFVPVKDLDKIEIHPPIAPFIARVFRDEFRGNTLFLGNLWSYSFR